jgi:hypothetical protein
MNPSSAQRSLCLRLLGWAGLSMGLALGIWLLAPSITASVNARQFLDAFAAQCLLWGLLDAGFGLMGLRHSQNAPLDRVRLSKLLIFSVRLSVAWVAIGLVGLVAGLLLRSPALAGHGAGVFLQAAYLCVFERSFSRRLFEHTSTAST